MENYKMSLYEDYVLRVALYMPPSASVDFILLVLGLKPALRTRLLQVERFEEVRDWCEKWGFFSHLDEEGFIFISPDQSLATEIITLDQSTKKHEYKLGLLFGYPKCCTKKIAEIGEHYIDDYEDKICSATFEAFFCLINPENYRKGTAFISHVPCSSSCFHSLHIAQQLALFVLRNKDKEVLNSWLKELEKIYKEDVCQFPLK